MASNKKDMTVIHRKHEKEMCKINDDIRKILEIAAKIRNGDPAEI